MPLCIRFNNNSFNKLPTNIKEEIYKIGLKEV